MVSSVKMGFLRYPDQKKKKKKKKEMGIETTEDAKEIRTMIINLIIYLL
jgi:hypothetical protein